VNIRCLQPCKCVWPSRDKENSGALDVPGGGRLIELEYAEVQDRKLRGQLRNVPRLELLVTLRAATSPPL